jgi:hypothetical protein
MKELNFIKFISNLMERYSVCINSLFAESKTLEIEIQKQLSELKYE